MRNIVAADASDIQRLAGDREIADTTLNIPHPYKDGMAEKFIVEQKERRDLGALFAVAITYLSDGEFVGIIGVFTRNPASRRVLEKIGMKSEGLRPQQIIKWGVSEDIEEFGLLKSDFDPNADKTI